MKKMKFTDCVDIVGSSCHKFDGTKVYVSTGAVDTDRIEPLDTEIVDYDGRPSRANLVAEENDILFAKMQATEKTLPIDEELSKHIYSTGFCAVRAKDHIITNKCLYYLLTSETFLEQKDKNCSGATQKAITNAGLEKIVISVPDLEQQTAFVEQMDAVRNMIVYRKEQLKKLDELVKSRFIEMFGDPVTNPKGWDKRKLSNECDIVTGNTPSRKNPEYYGDYIEWIKSDNINTPNATLTRADEYLSQSGLEVGRYVDAGAILMTCIAGSIGCIGNVAIADRKVSFNQQINGIIPKANNTWFMYVLFELTKKEIQSSINMALKGILSKGQLSEMEFIFPPIDLQNEFATFVEQTDKLKFEVKEALEKLETLKKSLMQQYFE